MCVHSKSLALAGAGIAPSVCVCVGGGAPAEQGVPEASISSSGGNG